MTRAKIVAIILFVFEICCGISIGKFLFHKVPYEVWSKEGNIDYEQIHKDTYIVKVTKMCPFCGKYHKEVQAEINSEELEKLKTTGVINLPWFYEGRREILLITYIILIFIGGIIAIAAFIIALTGDYDNRQLKRYQCDDCFFKGRCKLYKKVDDLDFSSIENQWNKFWGY